MPYARTIAIDGPAACGKSTLGTNLAETLGYFFLDTGILYRAIARHALTEQVHITRQEAVEAYASRLHLHVRQLQPTFDFRLNGAEVNELYSVQIDEVVPVIAAYSCVREKVRAVQREVANRGSVILAGRDIGTVVLPDAELKIYLNPSLEERAKRRFASQQQVYGCLENVKAALAVRDRADAQRGESPMQAAHDAITIVTDGMTIDAVVQLVLGYAERSPQFSRR